MVDISFEVNGWQVDPDVLGHVLGQSILRAIRRSINNRVGSIRCPKHGSTPTIIVKGLRLCDLSWEVFGCCSRLTDAVADRLCCGERIILICRGNIDDSIGEPYQSDAF